MVIKTDYCSNSLDTQAREVPITPKNGFQAYSTWGFFGTMKSGKTYNTIKLLKRKLQDGQLNRVFGVSPNFEHEIIWDEIPIYKMCTKIDDANDFLEEVQKFCKAEYEIWEAIRKTYTFDEFNSIFDKLKNLPPSKKVNTNNITDAVLLFSGGRSEWYDSAPSSALVLDDCINSDILSRSRNVSEFNKLFYKHRHCALEIFVLVQSLKNALPKQVRENIKIWVIWPYKDLKLMTSFYEESAGFICTKDEYIQILTLISDITDRNHKFVIFDSVTDNSPIRIGFDIICKSAVDAINFLQHDKKSITSNDVKAGGKGVQRTPNPQHSNKRKSLDNEEYDSIRSNLPPKNSRRKLLTETEEAKTPSNA